MNLKEQLADIYELWHIPFWQTKWFFWVSFTLIVFVCLLITFIIYKRINKKAVSACKQALDKLNKLHAIATVKHGKQFFYSLSTIIKTYLYEELYKNAKVETFKNIQGLTDDQIISLLPQIQLFNAEQIDNLKHIFAGINFIKFANQKAAKKNIDEALQSAKQFVEQTSKLVKEAEKGQ